MKKFLLFVCLAAIVAIGTACGASQGSAGDENISSSWADGTYVFSVYVAEDTCTPERKGMIDVLPVLFSRTSYSEEADTSRLVFYALEGKPLQFEGTLFPFDEDGRSAYLGDESDVSEEIEHVYYEGEFSYLGDDVFHGGMLSMEISGGYCATGALGIRQLMLVGVSYQSGGEDDRKSEVSDLGPADFTSLESFGEVREKFLVLRE